MTNGLADDRPFVANSSPVVTRFSSSSGHRELKDARRSPSNAARTAWGPGVPKSLEHGVPQIGSPVGTSMLGTYMRSTSIVLREMTRAASAFSFACRHRTGNGPVHATDSRQRWRWRAYGAALVADGRRSRKSRARTCRGSNSVDYHTGETAPEFSGRRRQRSLEVTPVVADGRMFISTPLGRVMALDPETGRELWKFDPKVDRNITFGDFTSRGVSYWVDSRRPAQPSTLCVRRVIVVTIDGRLIARHERGTPCAAFGTVARSACARRCATSRKESGTSHIAARGDQRPDRRGGSVADNSHCRRRKRRGRRSMPVPVRCGGRGIRSTGLDGRGMAHVDRSAPGRARPTPGASLPPIRRGTSCSYRECEAPTTSAAATRRQSLCELTVVALERRRDESHGTSVVHHDLWDYASRRRPRSSHCGRTWRFQSCCNRRRRASCSFSTGDTGVPVFGEERPVPASDVAEERSATTPFNAVLPPLSPQRLTPAAFGATTPRRVPCADPGLEARAFAAERRARSCIPRASAAHWGGVTYDPVPGVVAPVNRIPIEVTHTA